MGSFEAKDFSWAMIQFVLVNFSEVLNIRSEFIPPKIPAAVTAIILAVVICSIFIFSFCNAMMNPISVTPRPTIIPILRATCFMILLRIISFVSDFGGISAAGGS